MTYNLCVISKTGKHPLSYNFKTKAEAQKVANSKNKNITRFVIGGRGFPSRKDAMKWKAMAIKNPPIGYTRESYDSVLKIEPSKHIYKMGVCKN